MHHHTHGDDQCTDGTSTATVPTSITGTIPDTILVDMAMVNGERVSIPTSITVSDGAIRSGGTYSRNWSDVFNS